MRTPFNALYPVILTGIDTHKGIVIGAGNRSQDTAIVKTMSSALINRMFLMKELSAINNEIAQMVVSSDEGDALPSWFMVEIVRDLPRLVAADDGIRKAS